MKKEGVYSVLNPLTWFTYKIDNYKFYKWIFVGLTCDNNPDGNLDNRFEIFSYVAFSHSHALGVGAISGNSNFDLKTSIFQVYGTNTNMNSHLYHSWQFRQSLPETKAYWKMVIGNCSTPAYRIELLHNAF